MEIEIEIEIEVRITSVNDGRNRPSHIHSSSKSHPPTRPPTLCVTTPKSS